MAKIKWQISRLGYGPQCEVVANTRTQAIGIAEAKYLSLTDYQNEFIGSFNDDGTAFTRSPIPEYTAEKLGRSNAYRASDAAALRAQIHLQNLPGGPF